MSPQVGREVEGPAVLLCVGSRGPVADAMLTTDRMQDAWDFGAKP
jgi:hypothetical protein